MKDRIMSIIPGGTEHFKNVCTKTPLLSLRLAALDSQPLPGGKRYFKLYLQPENLMLILTAGNIFLLLLLSCIAAAREKKSGKSASINDEQFGGIL